MNLDVLKQRIGYIALLLLVGATLTYFNFLAISQAPWLLLYSLVSIILGDELIIRHDKFLFKQQIKKQIIKELKAQGLNPKDYEIHLKNIEIIEGKDGEEDTIELIIKSKED